MSEINNQRKKETIAVVVVTYNRKNLLIVCLDALINQTYPLDAIYIIDNASTDGTPELLIEKGYIDKALSPINEPIEVTKTFKLPSFDKTIEIHYVRMHENTGGAGGFHEGVKRGYEAGYDWLWLMDDDGRTDKNALFYLIRMANNYNYKVVLNCLVISKNNQTELAFPIKIKNKLTYNYIEVKDSNDIIIGGNPFNGTFIPSEVIKKIGFPDKRYFIKGDEKDYKYRIQKYCQFLTCKEALLYHPKPPLLDIKLFSGMLTFKKWTNSSYFQLRNQIWLCIKYGGKFKYLKIAKLLIHSIMGLIFQKNINKGLILKALKDGLLYKRDSENLILPNEKK